MHGSAKEISATGAICARAPCKEGAALAALFADTARALRGPQLGFRSVQADVDAGGLFDVVDHKGGGVIHLAGGAVQLCRPYALLCVLRCPLYEYQAMRKSCLYSTFLATRKLILLLPWKVFRYN